MENLEHGMSGFLKTAPRDWEKCELKIQWQYRRSDGTMMVVS